MPASTVRALRNRDQRRSNQRHADNPAIAAARRRRLPARPAPALASSSDWFETEGARVRLVTTGEPDADGMLRAFSTSSSKPGWKTYWRDPGDAGVPPTVDVSGSTNIAGAKLDFPPPQRHDDGDFQWAGYDHPVALPVAFTLKSPGRAGDHRRRGVSRRLRDDLHSGAGEARRRSGQRSGQSRRRGGGRRRRSPRCPRPRRPDFGVRLAEQAGERDGCCSRRSFPAIRRAPNSSSPARTATCSARRVREQRDGKTLSFPCDADAAGRAAGRAPGCTTRWSPTPARSRASCPISELASRALPERRLPTPR